MTKAPERIWAWRDVDRLGWGTAYCSDTISSGTEYIREDHALALVAVEREACAETVYQYALKNGKKIPATYDRIRARTNDDAQAALERTLHDTKTEWWNKGYKSRKREARNKALREALQCIADLETGHSEDVEVGHEQAYRAIEALITEDQSDE